MQEITSSSQLDTFVQSQPENVLTVVNISSNATPCVRVFPAVLALAKNFVGYAAFGRLLYETSDETQSLANQLKVREVGAPSPLAVACTRVSSARSCGALKLRAGWAAHRLLHVLRTMPYGTSSLCSIPCTPSEQDRHMPRPSLHSMAGWLG